MPDEKPKFPLRERRKKIIHDSLVGAAMKLFGEKGYENVTLEEVAEEAIVHVQTLYKYFKTKENLALALSISAHERGHELLKDPNRTEDIRSVWRKYRLEDLAQYGTGSVRSRFLQMGKMTKSVPALKSQNLLYWKRTETILTLQLAKDAGKDPVEDIHSRLLASMMVSSLLEVLRRWEKSGGALNVRKLYEEALDYIDQNFVRPENVK